MIKKNHVIEFNYKKKGALLNYRIGITIVTLLNSKSLNKFSNLVFLKLFFI